QLAELIKLAHEKQVTFMEAIWSRFMPLQLKLKQMLDEGVIGTPRLIQSNHGALLEDKERMYRPDLAGGALLDLGVYNVHFVMQMFGNDYATVSSSRSEEHTSELQSRFDLVCRLLLDKKNRFYFIMYVYIFDLS